MYQVQNWKKGDVISAEKLNHIESGIADTEKSIVAEDRVKQLAKAEADVAVANLINGAPETLDTIKEVADAIATNGDAIKAMNKIVSKNAQSIKTVEAKADENKTAIDALNAKSEALESKAVQYTDFAENRKTIQLANHNTISGLSTSGTGYNLAMVSKWDVADFGAAGLHANLNTKDNVTINDDKVIATVDQIPSVEGFATKEQLTSEAEKLNTAISAKADVETVNQLQSDLALKVSNEAYEADKAATAEQIKQLQPKGSYVVSKTNGRGADVVITTADGMGSISAIDENKVGGQTNISVDTNNVMLMANYKGQDRKSASLIQISQNALTLKRRGEDGVMKEVEVAELVESAKMISKSVALPINSIEDRVYEEKEILAWFGVAKVADLKKLINSQRQLRIDLSLAADSAYKQAINYAEIKNDKNVKLIFIGLEPETDLVTKYTIEINLDGTKFENSNIRITKKALEA